MEVSWSDFKTFFTNKTLPIQWIIQGSNYRLVVTEGSITIHCLLPADRTLSADTVDFEDNYKPAANAKIFHRSKVFDSLGNPITATSISGNLGLDVNLINRPMVDDISNGGGVQAALTVGTSAVEVKVGGSPLTKRKVATLYNNSLITLYWGYTNAVTTSSGTPIAANQFYSWAVGPGTSIFVIAGGAGNNTRITEAA